MNITKVKLKDLTPYKKNQKKHPKSQVDKIAMSIKNYGFRVPILVNENNEIVAGHGRYLAAKKLKLETVPVHHIIDLTEEQIKAYRIADNKVAESDWDYEFLKDEFKELKDADYNLDLTGFDYDEIGDLLQEDEKEIIEVGSYEREKVKTKIKKGEIYQLGNHRLMCGDSTDEHDINKLLVGIKPDLGFTDPPYNINYQDLKGNHSKIKNDQMGEIEFFEFLNNSLKNLPENSYVCCNWKYYHIFFRSLEAMKKPVKSCIVWDKEIRVQNLDKYFKQHEFILYIGKLGGERTIRGDVFKLKRERSTLHPTMKPIELCATFIKDSSKEKEIVYDPFGGSGSTLLAAEQLNRTCFMMELDPQYCEVICKRWEDLTGKERIKL